VKSLRHTGYSQNRYYPYGLKIATLSAKKLADVYEGVVKNNYLYQGAFAELDEDIQWTDFPLRNYDAEIGRWVQQDPYQQFASPYTGMGDDPANNIDPSGGIVPGGISGLSTTAEKAITLGEVVVSASKASSIVVKSSNTLMKVASLSANVFKVTNIINGAVTTFPVGIGPGDGLLDFPKNVSDFINTISTTTGYFSLPADAIKNLGGFDRAMKLFKEGKFTANFNDVSKVWSLKFLGTKM
jgi:RHS repeat-associated protein